MSDQYIVNLVTTAELEALVAANGLKQGLQYKNTDTGKLMLAISTSEYIYVESVPYKSAVGLINTPLVSQTSGLLEVGKTYTITDTVNVGDDFSNVGFSQVGVDFIATGTTPTNWTNGTRVCNLTDSPIEIIYFHNNIGNIVFTRKYPGYFEGVLNGAFGTPRKFWSSISPNFNTLSSIDYQDENTIQIQCGYDGSNYDYAFKNTAFEFRVYY